jgi:cell fate regulator YaaT (PSP1 superfamily)
MMSDIDARDLSPDSKDAEITTVSGTPPEPIFPYISVEFKGNRRMLFSNPLEFPFKLDDKVVVRVEKGEDLGRVIHLLDQLPEDRTAPEYEVLRKATPKDIKTLEEYRAREGEAKEICKEKIVKHGLEMKLVDVEYQFDGRKLIFYFTADGRIDFRQLVKDLAATFRTRIELRQIGARDEMKRFGGLGPCGRRLCCVTFITEFCPITTQMAKDMNLPLNPSKISGCCGRLKCCLQYELEVYRDALSELPRWDTRIETVHGPAVIEKLDVFEKSAYLRYGSGDLVKVEAADLKKVVVRELESATAPESTEDLRGLEDEVVSDEIDQRCRGRQNPSLTPAAQKQRKSEKRRPPHPQKRSDKFLHKQDQSHPPRDRGTNLNQNNRSGNSDKKPNHDKNGD